MIDGKNLVKDENECYNCGCNLKPACANYEDEGSTTQLRVQRLHESAKMQSPQQKRKEDSSRRREAHAVTETTFLLLRNAKSSNGS